jgi:carbamoyl-phosphate synthase large subunit
MYNVLFTAAGGGNTENLIRSLKKSILGSEIRYIGTNNNRNELAKSICDKNYLNPGFGDPDQFINTIMKIAIKERLDFIAFNHENEIDLISRTGEPLTSISFLPNPVATETCIDKQRLNKFISYNKDLEHSVPKSFQIDGLENLYEAFEYAGTTPVWVRTNVGSSSVGAAPMYTVDEATNWINYWVVHKGAAVDNFTISEYLPGRDIHCFSVWNEGKMIIGKCVERLEYLNSKITLSGTYSSPSVATMVDEPKLLKLAQDIVTSIDPKARGLYGIDFKQGFDKKFKMTEINIGRFPRINYLFNMVGPNMAEAYIRLGLGHPVEKERWNLPEEKYYLFREVDTIPVLKSEGDLDKCLSI